MITQPNEQVRALSWKEPFASLMLHGKIETRTWETKYRGLVLICASKTGYRPIQVWNITGESGQFSRLRKLVPCPLTDYLKTNGHAIAIGRLVDCRPMTKADEDKCFVQYHPDLYCHVYEDVRPIKPFPWKGSQGWKQLTEEQISKIELI